MKIYKCIITGDEVLCDNDRPLKELDDIVYVVEGKYITIGGDDYGISSNVDEDAAEGATADKEDGDKVKVVDVVHSNRLTETSFDKKSYMAYIKEYLKAIKDKLQEKNPSRVDAFQAGAQAFIKKVIGEFDQYQFFLGPSCEPEGITVLAKWDGEVAYFYFFKDGLRGEKV